MYTIQEAKQQILQALKQAVSDGFVSSMNDLVSPPHPALGDVAFACFDVAKKQKRDPCEIASELAAKIEPTGYLARVQADGPYVNIRFHNARLGEAVLKQVKQLHRSYGMTDVGDHKRVMVEYAQPNTHKIVHVGHLRNFFVGQTLVNVLKATGYEVIPACYIGDHGAHVAKSLWAMKHLHSDEIPALSARVDFLQLCYVEATAAAETSPNVKQEIDQIFQQLDQMKGPFVRLWRQTRRWSIHSIRSIFRELKLPVNVWYFESELVHEGRGIIDDLIQRGIVKQSEGAWIVDLEQEGLGVNLIVKSDGALLYNGKDIVLALKKEEMFHPVRSLYVVDTRQSLAMKQLFATLKRMGFTKELTHLSYEFVTLKDGAMASRKGNVIAYDRLRDAMLEYAESETRKRHPDWTDERVNGVADRLTFAAMRFDLLKQDLQKKIVFDFNAALDFNGFTGAYLLYTYARIHSLLKKAGKGRISTLANRLTHPLEHQLIKKMAEYPELVFAVSQRYALSDIPRFLFELSQTASEYYAAVPVLQAENPRVMRQRLGLMKATAQVLKNGLTLLGIETVDEM